MANPKVFAASILLALVLVHGVVEATEVSSNGTAKVECGGACAARCALSGRPNLCKRACGSCCATCNCVPPGTSGNYDACPCYAKLTTHDNKLKCP